MQQINNDPSPQQTPSRLALPYETVLLVASIFVGSILLIVLVIPLLAAHIPVPVKKVIEELGAGLIVAGLLGLTLESILKRRERAEHSQQLLEMRLDLFKYLFGYGIPPGLMNEIRDAILRSDFIRKDAEILIEFLPLSAEEQQAANEEFPGCGQLVNVVITSTSTIVNRSSTKKAYTFRPYLEQIVPYGEGAEPFKQFVPIRREAGSEAKVPRLLKDPECILSQLGNGSGKLEYWLDPDEELDITVKYVIVSNVYGTHSWLTVLPANGLNVTISLHPDLDLQVQVGALHRTDFQKRGELVAPSRTQRWSLNYWLLPNQGVELIWQKPRATTPATIKDTPVSEPHPDNGKLPVAHAA